MKICVKVGGTSSAGAWSSTRLGDARILSLIDLEVVLSAVDAIADVGVIHPSAGGRMPSAESASIAASVIAAPLAPAGSLTGSRLHDGKMTGSNWRALGAKTIDR